MALETQILAFIAILVIIKLPKIVFGNFCNLGLLSTFLISYGNC